MGPVAALGFLADDIKDGVNELSTLGVVTLGPIVTSTGLTKDEVVGTSNTHLQIHQNSSGNIAATSGLVVVHIDAFKLEVRVTVVGTGGVNSVLVRDDLPELGTCKQNTPTL